MSTLPVATWKARDNAAPPCQKGSVDTVATYLFSPLRISSSACGTASNPTIGILPASPAALRASRAPSAISSLAAHRPLTLPRCLASRVWVTVSASERLQFAVCWSSSSMPEASPIAACRPAKRCLDATLSRMPWMAMMPPDPPMASKRAAETPLPLTRPSKLTCATQWSPMSQGLRSSGLFHCVTT